MYDPCLPRVILLQVRTTSHHQHLSNTATLSEVLISHVYVAHLLVARLGAMTQLQTNFPEAIVGLSDHTTKNYACFGAVALGASILERHFTDHMQRCGSIMDNQIR